MKRCPKCGKFDVEYDSTIGFEHCLWRDCLWVNKDHVDLDKQEFKPNFAEFRESLKPKTKPLT